ncbi:MAG: tandem-95 repeat protein, partial [Acidobacteria bacterium]|nr:tandem-95 repeat protein [Acidobacteriota bacterium]
PSSGVVNSIWVDGVRCYVGTSSGVYVTNDGGVSWNVLSNGLSGCSGANNTNVVFAVASRLLAGSTGCGVYGSALSPNATNRAPIAYEQSVRFTEDTPVVISLSGFDADLDPLTYSIAAGPARGSLNGALPNITYTPNTNFNGRDAFTFRVSDGRLNSIAATISLEGISANDPPVLNVPGAQTVTVNQALTFTVTATDPDAGQTVTLGATGLPQGATFNAATGAFAWTPTVAGGYTLTFTATDNGTPAQTTTRTVSVTVNPPQANRPPVANNLAFTTPEETPRQITLTGSDPDNNPLTYIVVGQPQSGALTGTAPNLTYTPALNFAGSDQFTFKVNDGTVDSSLATVTINVTQVNDAPTLIVPGAQNVLAGQNINFKLDVEDPEKTQNQTYVYTSSNLPTGATLTKDPQSHRATFNWTPGTNGTTTINFTVTDSGQPPLSDTKTVTITVSGPSPIGNWISLRGNLPKVNNFDIGVRSLEGTGNRLFAATEIGAFTSTFANGVWDANWVAINNGIGANDRNLDYLTIINGKIYVSTLQGGKLFASEDNGANWTPINLNLPNSNYRIWFIRLFGDKLYLGTDYGIQVSSDNGVTWSVTLPNYSYFTAGLPYTFLSFENAFYVVTNRAPVVKRSDNGGATFTNLSNAPTIGPDQLTRLGATLFGFGYNVQSQYGLYKSTNSGSSWSLVTNAAPFTGANNQMKLYSFNDMLFADAGGYYFSTDAGLTWTKMDAGAAPTGGGKLSLFGSYLLATTPAYSVLPSTAANTAPVLTVPAAQTATVGEQKVFNVSATDANGGQTVTLSASGLPLGATFIAGTGRFSWTPALAGEYVVSFTALDNGTPALSQTKVVKLTVSAPANPSNGFWSQSNDGLELAGTVFGFAATGNKLFAKTQNGIYRFETGAWQSFSNGLPAVTTALPQARLVQDLQSDGGNLYALLTSGLYRSTDLGANWTKLSNATLPELVVNSYSLSVRGSTVLIMGQFNVQSMTVYFMRSTDGGVNFSPVGGSATPSFPNGIQAVANDYYAAYYNGILRSSNNGGTFTALGDTLTGPSFCFTANNQTLFAGSVYGAYRSINNGANWTQTNTGLPTGQPVISLHYSAPFLFAGTSQGVYYSLNNGTNWTAMGDGDVPQRIEAEFVFDGKLWVVAGTRSYGQPAYNNYQGVSVSPLPIITGNAVPTLTVNDSFTATTGTAVNFTVTSSGPEAAQTVVLNAAGLPQGATFTPATGAFSWTPLAAGTYYASFTATDNGTPALSVTKTVTFNVTGAAIVGNWTNVSIGLPAGNTITSLTALDTEVFAGTGTGIYKTSNNGASWTLSSEGFSQFDRSITYLTNINDILYAATFSAIYSSNDGGGSWSRLPASGTSPFGVVSLVGVGNTLIAVNQSSQVHVSTNFGTTWTVSTNGLPASFVGGALVVRGTTVLLGLNNYNTPSVYRSTNNSA